MSERDYYWLRIGVGLRELGVTTEELPRGVSAVFAVGFTQYDERVLFHRLVQTAMIEDAPAIRSYLEDQLDHIARQRPGHYIDPTTIRASRWDGTLAPPTEILLPPVGPAIQGDDQT